MRKTTMKHPAKELGAWLKAHRQKQGLVMRLFAGQIELSPGEYAETESGVVRWIGRDQERLICQVLELPPAGKKAFLKLLSAAREAEPLEFADIFTRAQLEPVRLWSEGRKRLTEAGKTAILDAVFTPLA